MALQADGCVAFFFEEAPCYEDDYTKGYSMVYIPLTIEEITEGSYSTPETAGGETGIDCIESTDNRQQTTDIYDLQGRRVENPVKGIYIVGGRVVVIR